MRWAKAQFTESAVASRSVSVPPPGSALEVFHGGSGGCTAVHGDVPFSTSFGEYPALRAAATPVSTKIPAPMMAPIPRVSRFTGPSVRFKERSPEASASARRALMDFVASRLMLTSRKSDGGEGRGPRAAE